MARKLLKIFFFFILPIFFYYILPFVRKGSNSIWQDFRGHVRICRYSSLAQTKKSRWVLYKILEALLEFIDVVVWPRLRSLGENWVHYMKLEAMLIFIDAVAWPMTKKSRWVSYMILEAMLGFIDAVAWPRLWNLGTTIF